MGRLLQLAEKAEEPSSTGTYGVKGVYGVSQSGENNANRKEASQGYAINAINVVSPKVAALNAELERLHIYLIRLRCSDPPKGTRQDALAYVAAGIDKLAALSAEAGGTADGWDDPADEFADGDQITALRFGLAELAGGPYPLPLPEGCTLLPQANFDALAYGRLYNGKPVSGNRISARGSCRAAL